MDLQTAEPLLDFGETIASHAGQLRITGQLSFIEQSLIILGGLDPVRQTAVRFTEIEKDLRARKSVVGGLVARQRLLETSRVEERVAFVEQAPRARFGIFGLFFFGAGEG